VLVSPQRTARPWAGQVEVLDETQSTYDPNCYLCPGNERASGSRNPDYPSTYVFLNDFPAMIPGEFESSSADILMLAEPVSGECRVICYSPKHNLTMADMDVDAIEDVIQTWIVQDDELSQTYSHVQIFENRGSAMGCSNPHPHGQIWASNFIPTLVQREDTCQKAYMQKAGKNLLLDYVEQELAANERIVLQNDSWVWLVPFWATWPFEVLLLPRQHIPNGQTISLENTRDLAQIMKAGLEAYDRLFSTSFPYSMGWHSAPSRSNSEAHWQLHCHFYPPLLRSATVRKHMVGYEMLAESQRDLTPELAAQRLRDFL
jgi:UDPglucose--hexose-1-phosphate uridylyltransferase